MISVLDKKITLRYLKPKKKEGFLNIISIFSFIGISLGVAVLIIVMSVMNGFRTELANKIIGFNAHIIVEPYNDSIDSSKISNKNLINLSKNLIFTNNGEAVLINKNATKGLVLRGYSQKDFFKLEFIKKGNFVGNPNLLNENNISIGRQSSYLLFREDRASPFSARFSSNLLGFQNSSWVELYKAVVFLTTVSSPTVSA